MKWRRFDDDFLLISSFSLCLFAIASHDVWSSKCICCLVNIRKKIDVLLIADKKIAVLGQDFFPIITFTTKNHSDEMTFYKSILYDD